MQNCIKTTVKNVHVLKLTSSVLLLLFNKLIYMGRTKLRAKTAAANKENPHVFKSTKRSGCLGKFCLVMFQN